MWAIGERFQLHECVFCGLSRVARLENGISVTRTQVSSLHAQYPGTLAMDNRFLPGCLHSFVSKRRINCHSRHSAEGRLTSYPGLLITVLPQTLDFLVLIPLEPLELLCQKYCRLLQVGEGIETGQHGLTNKPLLTPFPHKKQEQTLKNKESGPTSPETARITHKWVQWELCQRQLAHWYICNRNKAPDIACQRPRLPPPPLTKPSLRMLCRHMKPLSLDCWITV
jgi:hypothetical protein